jgi:hypothetical protein
MSLNGTDLSLPSVTLFRVQSFALCDLERFRAAI